MSSRPAGPTGPPLDRATIKNSFQQLFTPNMNSAQPGENTLFFPRTPMASGLTPFLNGGVTPNLITPNIGMMPMSTQMKGDPQNRSVATPDMLMSSPYLRAAAKEAVRREFLNMPSYIPGAVNVSPTSEQAVPAGELAQRAQQHQLVYTKDGQLVPSTATATSGASPSVLSDGNNSPTECEARVPGIRASTLASGKNVDGITSPGNQRVPQTSPNSSNSDEREGSKSAGPESGSLAQDAQQTNSAQHTSQPTQSEAMGAFMQRQPFFHGMPQGMHPQGMFFMPPNAQMMMPGPHPNAVFMHPGNGMMMFAPPGAGHHQMLPAPGMMMPSMPPQAHMAHAAAAAATGVRPPSKPTKPETGTERKARIECEKQDLIREFKKKTREAALVRFRQKRRERRFGKLIRYECRKQLADARPRVKGRFVRIKTPDSNTEDSESAQVVPSLG